MCMCVCDVRWWYCNRSHSRRFGNPCSSPGCVFVCTVDQYELSLTVFVCLVYYVSHKIFVIKSFIAHLPFLEYRPNRNVMLLTLCVFFSCYIHFYQSSRTNFYMVVSFFLWFAYVCFLVNSLHLRDQQHFSIVQKSKWNFADKSHDI